MVLIWIVYIMVQRMVVVADDVDRLNEDVQVLMLMMVNSIADY